MMRLALSTRHCERSEAIQSLSAETVWIASSQELLAMTEQISLSRHPEVAASSAALEGRRPGSFILRGSRSASTSSDERYTLARG
jgi:hypothetical protein